MIFGLVVICVTLGVTVASPGVSSGSADTGLSTSAAGSNDAGISAKACSSTAAVDTPHSSEEPEIVELYPNPAARGDPGEFVTLRVPDGTNLSAYEIADEHVRVSLSEPPEDLSSGESLVTYSSAPNRTDSLTNRTTVKLSDRIQLADRGDSVRLVRNDTTVDTVEYSRAPEAEVYHVETESWEPLCATNKSVVTADGGTVEAFVLPDEPGRAVEFLDSATERILLAGYTLSADAVVDTLVDAHEEGVDVEVLVDGSPVGGMAGSGAAALDTLAREGVTVEVVAGEKARYRYHHAKYAVVDERALVTTENWKKSGTGGKSSRGWGVITRQQEIVDGLVDTFRADTGWVDTVVWEEYDDVTLVDANGATGTHPQSFEATPFQVDRTRLLVAPDNFEDVTLETIEGAKDSIDIKQVRVSDPQFPLLQAVLDAAARGVEVRILLSGKWYVEEENEQLKRWLGEQAESANLPLSVRIADPDGEFEKIHAKGVIVDGETTYVGSVNWNNNSVQNNREVGLLIDSEEVAAYFESVFDSDWEQDDSWTVPLGYLAACFVGAILAVMTGRKLEFEN